MDKKRGGQVTILVFVFGLFGIVFLSSTDSGTVGAPARNVESASTVAAYPVMPLPEIPVELMSDSMRKSEEARHQAFWKETLYPLAAEISESYPLTDLREEFRTIFSRMNVRGVMSLHPSNPNVFAACIGPGAGYGELELFLPKAETDFGLMDRETYKDMLLAVFLHEHHHFETSGCRQDATDAEAFQNESDTWWWMCDHILAPMRANGRLGGLQERNTFLIALEAYDGSFGDRTSEAWTTFADSRLHAQ